MFYPLNLHSTTVFPLLGNQLEGDPYLFDFSSNNPQTLEYRPDDYPLFNYQIFTELEQSGCSWGIGRYLEERKNLLRDYPQIIEQQRFYHLGLDIVAPYGTDLYAPLPARVYRVGKESAVGSYGGYVILEHEVGGTRFYSFYGHLKTPPLVREDQVLEAGERFAQLGKETDSGGWFSHLHLQVLTDRAVDEGLLDWGYASPDWFPQVEAYFPSPYPLFRF